MKKMIILLFILLLAFSFGFCKQKDVKFSEDEIENAITLVQENFDFSASTLTKVWYDEENSKAMTKSYIENGRGSENGVKAENVIVLMSNFDVEDSEGDGLTPNTSYTDFNWWLIRTNKSDPWKIDDWGY